MIRILHILHSMNCGGAEAMLMNYYRSIDRTRVQFDFLLTEQNRCQYESEIESLGGRVYRVPLLTIAHSWAYINGVKHFLMVHDEYKVIHSHTSSKSAVPLWVAKECGVPIRICHVHSSDSGQGMEGLVRKMLCVCLKRVATDFMACGDGAARCWYGDKYMDRGKVKIVQNAVDLDKYIIDNGVRDQIRKKYEMGQASLVLGMVARFHPVKNHLFALEVLKMLKDKGMNAKLLLVGDGELRDEIEKRIANLGIVDDVKMIGVVSDVHRYLQAMDVVLMPSFNEGLPVSLIEAQASGLSCIVSTGVPREVDITGNVHFLPLNVDVWVKRICLNIHLYEKRDAETIKKVRKAGYDIKEASHLLEQWYLDKIRSSNQKRN